MNRAILVALVLCLVACSGGNNDNNPANNSGDDTGDTSDMSVSGDTGDETNPDEGNAGADTGPTSAGAFSVMVDGTLVEFDEDVSIGRYSANGWFELQGKVAGATGRHELFVNFEDNGVGTFDCGEPRRVHIIYYYPESGFPVVAQNTTAGSSCEVDVTAVGEVGEPMTGTFSGTIANNNGSVEFTNGQFNLPRGDDL